MKTLSEMTLNEKVDTMMKVVEQAEIYLSKKDKTVEEVDELSYIMSEVFSSIKEHFYVDEEKKAWNGDAFDAALNSQYPGLSFRTNSVMFALENLYQVFLEINENVI